MNAKTIKTFLNGRLYSTTNVDVPEVPAGMDAGDRMASIISGWKRQLRIECSGRGHVKFEVSDAIA